jgi:hypothetical protein
MVEFTPSIILYPLSPHSWNSYIHVFTVFVPYSPSYTLSPHPPHSHCYQLPFKKFFLRKKEVNNRGSKVELVREEKSTPSAGKNK